MAKKARGKKRNWLNFHISIIVTAVLVIACFGVYELAYARFNSAFISDLRYRAEDVGIHACNVIRPESFAEIGTRQDEEKDVYLTEQHELNRVRGLVNAQYLYTAKLGENGTLVYVVDGLAPNDPDFRHPGDLIEPEMIDKLSQCLEGQPVFADALTPTDWGHMYVAYWPVKDEAGAVVGAVGMEFNMDRFVNTSNDAVKVTAVATVVLGVFAIVILTVVLRKVSEPYYKKLAVHDHLTGLPNRMAFEQRLRDISFKDRQGVSMVMLDVNGVTVVNNKLGRAAGDAVIRNTAKIMANLFEELGECYRVGGDEFCVLTQNASPEKTQAVINKLAEIKEPVYKQCAFSVLCGMAAYDQAKDANLRHVMERAEREMKPLKA